MPGLSAVFQLDGAPADQSLLHRLSEAAAHRGPRSIERVDGPIALAWRGDETDERSEGVVVDPDTGLRIVLTGRLYNGAELSEALGLGRLTDARVILAAYREWGTGALARLDGDFAFILHDARRRAVLGACDRLGMLPLVYASDGRRFLAGSEPKQLLRGGVSPQPSDEMIADFLTGERHLMGGPRTFYRDILRLEPAHWMMVDAGGIRVERYWRLDPDRRIEERSEEQMSERVRSLIIDAVERRVPPVGPYGCALTGGFDSSSIVALLRRSLDARGVDDPIESFSFELRDLAADEPELIKAVSAEFRTNHHSIYLDQENVFEVISELSSACDGPMPNMGLLYMWRKKEAARRHGVQVVLSGLGGDELFFGAYQHFADLLRRFQLRALYREMSGLYPINRTTGQRTTLRKLMMFLLLPLVPRAIKQNSRFLLHGPSMGRPWIRKDLARRVGLNAKIRRGAPRIFPDAFRQACCEVFQFPLVNGTLPLHEALGAAFGVETRFPLLDHRLVEYMFAVPREFKICEGRSRILQRRAMRGILPEIVVQQHLKKNMNPVFTRQQAGHFRDELERLLARKELRCFAYLDEGQVRRSLEAIRSGSGGSIARFVLWRTVSLERWLETVELPGDGSGSSRGETS